MSSYDVYFSIKFLLLFLSYFWLLLLSAEAKVSRLCWSRLQSEWSNVCDVRWLYALPGGDSTVDGTVQCNVGRSFSCVAPSCSCLHQFTVVGVVIVSLVCR